MIAFGCPLTSEGITLEETWDAAGMRGTGSHDLVFDNVFIAESQVIGRLRQEPDAVGARERGRREGDQAVGVALIRKAIEEPLRWIATNAGQEGSIIDMLDLIWADGGFIPYSSIGGLTWREDKQITLVLMYRMRSLARRLVVPDPYYGAARRLLRGEHGPQGPHRQAGEHQTRREAERGRDR